VCLYSLGVEFDITPDSVVGRWPHYVCTVDRRADVWPDSVVSLKIGDTGARRNEDKLSHFLNREDSKQSAGIYQGMKFKAQTAILRIRYRAI